MLTHDEVLTLSRKAACAGQVNLFMSINRADSTTARDICSDCPVQLLCYLHVDPGESYFSGTCAGDLYFDGLAVTDLPNELPPPEFREEEVDTLEVESLIEGHQSVWKIASVSSQMAACWLLRKNCTIAKIARLAGTSKERAIKLIQCFDEEAPKELRDFLADLGSEEA
jgi:hypothetical protein